MNNVFFTVSLGCPKNLADLEVISGSLLQSGFILSDDPELADIYIINSCAFIPAARLEAENEIIKAVEWKKRSAGRKIIVSGCLGAYDTKGDYRKKYPEVDLWPGIDDVEKLPEILDSGKISTTKKYICSEKSPRLQLTLPHLAYLKIADGCNNCCSYCAIPRLRGALRSRPLKSIVAEAAGRIASGVKEFVIVAQDVSAYGMDRPDSGEDLPALLRKMNKLDGDFKMRLLYTHPAHYSDELIDVIAQSEKVLPYIDMPLQHISDHLLKSMNRHVTSAEIETLLAKLRSRIPNLVLRSTFITGLPGETEADYAQLEDFCRRMDFERIGVFPFAPEPGTIAAKLPDQVPAEVAEERATKLMKKQISRMKKNQKKRIGKREIILIDGLFDDRSAWGRSYFDAPEIDNIVILPKLPKKYRQGDFCEVEIVGVKGCDVIAEAVKKERK